MTLPKGDEVLCKLLELWKNAPEGEERRTARIAVCKACQDQGLKTCDGNCQIAAEDEADDEFAEKFPEGFHGRTFVFINGRYVYTPGREGD